MLCAVNHCRSPGFFPSTLKWAHVSVSSASLEKLWPLPTYFCFPSQPIVHAEYHTSCLSHSSTHVSGLEATSPPNLISAIAVAELEELQEAGILFYGYVLSSLTAFSSTPVCVCVCFLAWSPRTLSHSASTKPQFKPARFFTIFTSVDYSFLLDIPLSLSANGTQPWLALQFLSFQILPCPLLFPFLPGGTGDRSQSLTPAMPALYQLSSGFSPRSTWK